jgi:hypothetical protein
MALRPGTKLLFGPVRELVEDVKIACDGHQAQGARACLGVPQNRRLGC